MPTLEAHPTKSTDHAPVAHHFDDWKQQYLAMILGMWVFLVTEVMFFGGLFTAYMIYRNQAPQTFAAASRHLDIRYGGVNTVVLLTSSFTIALGVWAAHHRDRQKLLMFMLATLVLGLAFMGIKFTEYVHKYNERLIPVQGLPFNAAALEHAEEHTGPAAVEQEKAEETAFYLTVDPGAARLFYGLYFAMTGVHFLHMVIGIVILAIMLRPALRGGFTNGNFVPIEIFGLYWHFVDIVWIFLFPLLYLIDRTSHGT